MTTLLRGERQGNHTKLTAQCPKCEEVFDCPEGILGNGDLQTAIIARCPKCSKEVADG